jgi:hypothetical protein
MQRLTQLYTRAKKGNYEKGGPDFCRLAPNDSWGYGDHIVKYLIFWIIIDSGKIFCIFNVLLAAVG